MAAKWLPFRAAPRIVDKEEACRVSVDTTRLLARSRETCHETARRGDRAPVRCIVLACHGGAAEPLHKQIDTHILARAKGKIASPLADDAECLAASLSTSPAASRPWPSAGVLLDKTADKSARRVDQLLAGPDYPRRMQELFHVMLMERLGDTSRLGATLRTSFEKNKPWDQMARELLHASSKDAASRGAAFFLAKRPGELWREPRRLSRPERDLGRLFLGVNLQCAQCHDHLFIRDYSQRDFQGLFAFVAERLPGKADAARRRRTPDDEKVSFCRFSRRCRWRRGHACRGERRSPSPP